MLKGKLLSPRRSRQGDLTLPDYLRPGLKLVFIGLNPGHYSAQQGKYFARSTNRFWPALSASKFFGLQVKPGDERMLFEQGIGFTDIVKRASGQIDELTSLEIAAGAKILRRKLLRHSPQVAAFIGITGYRWLFNLPARTRVAIGPQLETIGETLLYVLPSTSPANAHFSLQEIIVVFRDFRKWLRMRNIFFALALGPALVLFGSLGMRG